MPELAIYSYRLIKLDLTLGYTDFELVTDGRKITYASPSDGPEVQIRLQLKSNDQIPLRPQGTIHAPFQRLYVSASAVAKTIFLLVSSPDVDLESRDVNVNNITTVGTVSLISTLTSITNPVVSKAYALDRAQNNQLFERTDSLGASAGNVSEFQVFNPIGSGKTTIVLAYKFQDSSTSALGNRITVRQYNTPLATLVGNFYNTHSGQPNSTAELRAQQPITIPASNIMEETVPAVQFQNNDGWRERFDVLDAGKGILVANYATGVGCIGGFRIIEF